MMIRDVKLATNTIRFRCDDALVDQADWLTETVQGIEQERGVGFLKAGKRIEIGWTILTVVAEPDGLWLHEPDYATDPFHKTNGDLTTSLFVLAQQTTANDKLDVELMAVSFQDKIIFASGSLEYGHVYLERSAPDPGDRDSGWFVGYADDGKDNEKLEAIYVYELLKRRPALLQMLMLPPGFMVVFQDDEVEVIIDADGDQLFPDE